MMPASTLETKHREVCDILGGLGSVAVAFSGGVDSSLMLKLSIDTLGLDKVVAVTGRSASLASFEFAHAQATAESLGATFVAIDTDEFDNVNYTSNPVDRCYYCKTTLYEHLARLVAERGLGAMVNGTNADDLGDYRPGHRAATEFTVHSPMADAGLTKADVRELAKRLGLASHDKPASPCLSSRVPYGESVTPEKLRMIEDGERFLHELGVDQCRVRHHGKLARIEVPLETIARLAEPVTAREIDEFFRSLGFQYVTLDLRGFRSGSMNEFVTLGIAPARA